MKDQKKKHTHQIHTLERVATLVWRCGMRLGTPPAYFKSSPETIKTKKAGRMTQTSIWWTGEDRQIPHPFQPKNGYQTNRTINDISCAFLRSRLELQSWNSFSSFPIINKVSAPLATPSDSGKKGHQNWHKTMVKPQVCISSLLTESGGNRPRGAVGIAALLCRWQTACGGSIPSPLVHEQDSRP